MVMEGFHISIATCQHLKLKHKCLRSRIFRNLNSRELPLSIAFRHQRKSSVTYSISLCLFGEILIVCRWESSSRIWSCVQINWIAQLQLKSLLRLPYRQLPESTTYSVSLDPVWVWVCIVCNRFQSVSFAKMPRLIIHAFLLKKRKKKGISNIIMHI